MIQINYNDKVYAIQVLEVKPNLEEHSGISVIETDLEVDFAPPVGYVEPTKQAIPSAVSRSLCCIDCLIHHNYRQVKWISTSLNQ
jgi:ubiquitin fusion degradation protein 1